jgi:hypothetical protein
MFVFLRTGSDTKVGGGCIEGPESLLTLTSEPPES